MPLMRTKLNRPAVSSSIVSRPRLIARLNEGLERRVTLISAAAGFGKTTLAVQWLDHCPVRSAWLSLESEDSEPERFLRYVVAAVQTAVPDFGENITRLLSAVRLPPPEYLADVMVSELALLKDPILLVLDDFYTIQFQPVQDIMLRMVSYLPKNMHFAVLTRVDPLWPLAKWRTSVWLNELRAADLSFSNEETERFFNRKDLTSGTLKGLHQRTEGWIAGLQLLKLSLADAKDPDQLARDFSDSDRLIVDYLMDEVISRQPQEVLDFLAVTGLFDRFCALLCDHMLADVPGRQEGRQLLGRLEQENLFLVPLDRERMWYRYHHLFRDLINHHLTAKLPREQKDRVRKRAGDWFARQGIIEEAIKCYLDAGAVDAASGLVEEHLHAVIDADLSRRQLKRLLQLFPPQVETTRPALLIAHAYVQLFSWNFPAVKKLHAQIDDLLKDAGDAIPEARRLGIQGDMEAQKAFYRYQLGEVKESLESASRALDIVPKEHRFARGLAIMYTAAGCAAIGRKDQAFRFLEAAFAGSVDGGSTFIGQVGLAQMAIHYNAGDFNPVLQTADLVLARNEQVHVPDYYLAFPHYFRGTVAYERNQLDAATKHFETVVAMRYFEMPSLYHDCLVGLALVAHARGEAARVGELVHAAMVQAQEANDSYIREISEGLAARFAIQGRTSQSVSLAPPRLFENIRFLLLTPSLVQLESEILQGQPAECRRALPMIDAGIAQAERVYNVRQAIQYLAVKAIALQCAGRPETALRVVEKALNRAKPLGFIRTFLDRGPSMEELMRLLLEKHPKDGYLLDLLAAFDAEKYPGTVTAALNEKSQEVMQERAGRVEHPSGLSNRELDVLTLLEQRLSNKEIADQLHVSKETVKTHTINLYRKLDVNKRRDAVAAARQRGLLK